jgi:hypothetical protein
MAKHPDEIANLKLRFPEVMRARLAEEAKRNQRSLNGEIVYRLGTTFGAEGVALVDQYEAMEEEISRQMREVMHAVREAVLERRRDPAFQKWLEEQPKKKPEPKLPRRKL